MLNRFVTKLKQTNYAIIYDKGSQITMGILGVSNFCAPFIIRDNTTDYNALDYGTFTVHSIIKSFAYGLIWPIFWPHAISKAIMLKSDIIEINGHKINRNGMLSHYIPLSSMKKRLHKHNNRQINS